MKKLSVLLAAAVAAVVLAACSSTSSDTATPAASTTVPAAPSSTRPADEVTADSTPASVPIVSDPTVSATSSSADGSSASAATPAGSTAITITVGDTVFNATLNETQVSQDFIKTLPTTLPWFRNSGIEYITELPAPLTETGPFYTDVQPGDLVYYNPADSITIIYEEAVSVPTLTKMGQITSNLSAFPRLADNVEMRIELA